jgi:hypothetical protein
MKSFLEFIEENFRTNAARRGKPGDKADALTAGVFKKRTKDPIIYNSRLLDRALSRDPMGDHEHRYNALSKAEKDN